MAIRHLGQSGKDNEIEVLVPENMKAISRGRDDKFIRLASGNLSEGLVHGVKHPGRKGYDGCLIHACRYLADQGESAALAEDATGDIRPTGDTLRDILEA